MTRDRSAGQSGGQEQGRSDVLAVGGIGSQTPRVEILLKRVRHGW